jgi:hypothetical protein
MRAVTILFSVAHPANVRNRVDSKSFSQQQFTSSARLTGRMWFLGTYEILTLELANVKVTAESC